MTDHNNPNSNYDDDEPKANLHGRFTEFNCPDCTANNPMGDGFTVGDEIRCMYCGLEYKVQDRGDGRIKLREM